MMSAIRPASVTTGQPPQSSLSQLLDRPSPLVMGVLNVTPDSFSDGGQFDVPDRALAQARRMIAEGADLIDIGAESTRPYGDTETITVEEELRRLRPVLPDLVALGTPVSVDTMKAEVADWALANGAVIANDVWGLQRDPRMAGVVSSHGAPVIVMHNRDSVDPAVDIVADMVAFFERTLAIAASARIASDRIILDPGIGFGKTAQQSITALAKLAALQVFGCPILVGASRKRFITTIVPSEPHQRLGGSIAAHLLAVQNGAHIIRAHDVADTVQALRVAAAIEDQR
jgi:dihydropteroate synthase